MKRVLTALAVLLFLVLFARGLAAVVMSVTGSAKGSQMPRAEAEGVDVSAFDQLFLDCIQA